jgi:UDP:flavonoid glycosyltransferase YjiC (YdhE family)
MWQQGRSADTAARQQVLELPAAPFFGPFKSPRLQNSPVLYGFSEAVIAKPADWGSQAHITGYWFLESERDWQPPPGLEAFLQRGPTPISIGFGSMSSRKAEETAQLILQALAKSGQRAILLTGWKGLQVDTLPENVFALDSAPHEWLFSHVSAVVHHGGAGTTAAGLRAGVPSIVVPFFADQPFWGQRVADLGVGPAPIPRKKLTADRLAQAIQQAVQDSAMQQRASSLGEKIRAENGIARAVALIEHQAMSTINLQGKYWR